MRRARWLEGLAQRLSPGVELGLRDPVDDLDELGRILATLCNLLGDGGEAALLPLNKFITRARSRTTASGRRFLTLRRANVLPIGGRNADGRR